MDTNQFQIIPLPALQDNYIWILINAEKQAIIIDPGESTQVLSFLQTHQLHPIALLITHHHWDHTNGIDALVKTYNIPVWGPALEKIRLLTHPLTEKEQIALPNFPTFSVLDIPGHTLGHIAYYTPGLLFCGDTLFTGGCGRLFEGTASLMFSSLMKMAALPDDTLIYCAHEYTANNLRFAKTIEPNNLDLDRRIEYVAAQIQKNIPTVPATLLEEKKTNPFLRCDVPAVIQAVEKQTQKHLPDAVSVFQHLRALKDAFK